MRNVRTLFVLAGLCVASEAAATDGKNYSANQCTPWQGAFTPGAVGSIMNQSTTTWLGVDCPAVKDQVGAIDSGWIRVLDRNNNSPIECELVSVHADGPNLVKQGSGVVPSPTDPSWRSMGVPGANAGWGSSVFFSCRVPPVGIAASGILSYHVEEL